MSKYIIMITDGLAAPEFARNIIHRKGNIYEVIPRIKNANGQDVPGLAGEGKVWDSIANGLISMGAAVVCDKDGKEKSNKAGKKSEAEKEENKMISGEKK